MRNGAAQIYYAKGTPTVFVHGGMCLYSHHVSGLLPFSLSPRSSPQPSPSLPFLFFLEREKVLSSPYQWRTMLLPGVNVGKFVQQTVEETRASFSLCFPFFHCLGFCQTPISTPLVYLFLCVPLCVCVCVYGRACGFSVWSKEGREECMGDFLL